MEIKYKECPLCHSKKIAKKTGSVMLNRDGRDIHVPRVRFKECRSCGERFYSSEATRHIFEYVQKRRTAA